MTKLPLADTAGPPSWPRMQRRSSVLLRGTGGARPDAEPGRQREGMMASAGLRSRLKPSLRVTSTSSCSSLQSLRCGTPPLMTVTNGPSWPGTEEAGQSWGSWAEGSGWVGMVPSPHAPEHADDTPAPAQDSDSSFPRRICFQMVGFWSIRLYSCHQPSTCMRPGIKQGSA